MESGGWKGYYAWLELGEGCFMKIRGVFKSQQSSSPGESHSQAFSDQGITPITALMHTKPFWLKSSVATGKSGRHKRDLCRYGV